ncbi:MAG: hypothetical protein K0Q92_2181 [Steroidobacteraceae bacterium]|jgi:hypothetical protein|nr:hypothetical protein [Steroidobacteraceae bacterium]
MKPTALALTGALLFTLGSGTRAQPAPDRHFYAGIDIGQAELNPDHSESHLGARRERESTAWKLRFGYQFSPRFALEAAYTDFGDYDGSAMGIFVPTAAVGALAPGDYTTSAKGMELSAVGTWPLGEVFYLGGAVGIQRREFKSVFEATTAYQPGFRVTDGDVATQLGLGFGFKLTDTFDVGVNWVTARKLRGDTDYAENASDPSMVSLGLRARF